MSATHGTDRPLSSFDTPVGLARAIVATLPIEAGAAVLEPHVGSGAFLQALAEVDGPALAPLRALPGEWTPCSRHGRPYLLEGMDLDPMAPGLDIAAATHLGIASIASGGTGEDPAQEGFLVTAPTRPPSWVIGNPPWSRTPPRFPCPTCEGAGIMYREGRKLVRWKPGLLGVPAEPCRTCAPRPAKGGEGTPGPGYVQPPPIPVAHRHVLRALEVAPNVAFVLRLNLLGSTGRRDFWAQAGLAAVSVIRPRPSFTGGGADSCEYAVFRFKRGHRGPWVGDFLDADPSRGWEW